MTSLDTKEMPSGKAAAADFDRPLLLTPGEDLFGYITGKIGSAALFITAATSVLAVLLILYFVVSRGGLFLTTTDGDTQRQNRQTVAQKALVRYEAVLAETGNKAQADQAVHEFRAEMASLSPMARARKAREVLLAGADHQEQLVDTLLNNDQVAENNRTFIQTQADQMLAEVRRFNQAGGPDRLEAAVAAITDAAVQSVYQSALWRSGNAEKAAAAADEYIQAQAEEVYKQAYRDSGNKKLATQAKENVLAEAEQAYREIIINTGNKIQADAVRQQVLAQADAIYNRALEETNSPAQARRAKQQVQGDAQRAWFEKLEETGDRAKAAEARQAIASTADDVYNRTIAETRSEKKALQAKQNFIDGVRPRSGAVAGHVIHRLGEMFGATAWDPEHSADPEYGMLALIYGSLLVTFGALLFAVPLGVVAAVVLSDIVPFKVRQIFKPIIELLAAIPSVAFGFFAILVVSPWMTKTLGFDSGTNALNAAVILGIMAIPTIVSVAEDSLSALGRDLREASYALGATRVETIFKVIIPAAHNGIIAAVILGMMRAIGETMVVWMAAGNASQVPGNWWNLTDLFAHLQNSVATMTATIAGDMGESAEGSIHRSALFTVGLLLLIFTFILNMVTEYFSTQFRKGMGASGAAEATGVVAKIKAAFVAVGRAIWFVPGLVFRLVGKIIKTLGHYLYMPIDRAIEPVRMQARLATNNIFTGVALLSVVFLGLSLVIVIGPIFVNGAGAVFFDETVEHRIFLHDRFGRGSSEQLQSQIDQAWAARQPLYDAIDQYAWLAPDELAREARAYERDAEQHFESLVEAQSAQLRVIDVQYNDARQANNAEQMNTLKQQMARAEEKLATTRKNLRSVKKLLKEIRASLVGGRRGFQVVPGALTIDDKDEVLRRIAEVKELSESPAGKLLIGTPGEKIFRIARVYGESIRNADLTLRDKSIRPMEGSGLPNELSMTYEQAYLSVREKVLRLLGPADRKTPAQRDIIKHIPPESRFGALHYDMAEEYQADLVTAQVWVPMYDEQGNPLANVKRPVPRKVLFAGAQFAQMREMLDYAETNLSAMMEPKFKFYYRYFTDEATAGHFLGGVGPEVLGTLLMTLVAICVALPLGVIAAAYLVEVAGDNVVVRTLRICINTLAGVPSIVFGLFGLAFFVMVLLPLFSGGEFHEGCVLTAGLTLAVLILPIIIRASEEAIRSVPQTYKEASLGLGAGKLRCFVNVTLPAALPGILTGTILGMSRAAGETAPILFTGAVAFGGFATGLFSATPALSYSSYDLAVGDDIARLVPYNQWGMVATLITLVLLLNFAAIIIRGRVSKRLKGM
jgi:phosphate ABC transporter permease protein PstC/phosphate ABC transporter permease subunit PstA